MKVLLLKNIKDIGSVGEIKEVKRGFALNYLFPNNLAAMPGSVDVKINEKKKSTKVDEKELQILKNKMKNLYLTFAGEANEQGTLYASIDKQMVEKELVKKGIKTKVHDLKPAHLKAMGEHKVEITVDNGIKSEIKITINPK